MHHYTYANFQSLFQYINFKQIINYIYRFENSQSPFQKWNFEKFCEELWKADVNRLRANIDYSLDTQGQATGGQDNAEQSLFTSVSNDALKKPTFKGKCGFRNKLFSCRFD